MADEKILGIEGGGTKTAWALVVDGAIVESGKLPPSNLRLTPLDQMTKIFRVLPREVDRIGVFLAGCATEEDRAALLKLARAVWPKANIVAGSDRDSGMAACLRDRDGIAVNAGTGSSVTGRSGCRIENAGGWGHILGDAGGAYFVSIRALRSILREYDLRRGEREFAANILRALGLNNFDELVRWAQTADKTEIAALAPVVFRAADDGDNAAQEIISAGATVLAHFAAAVATRLELKAPEVRLMGGLYEHRKSYVEAFRGVLEPKVPKAHIVLIDSAPEIGAAWLAANGSLTVLAEKAHAKPEIIGATEEPHPTSGNLEKLSAREFVEFFVGEEKSVERALRRAHALGTKTILLTCNPTRGASIEADLAINLATGPEIIAGSTRLKAGTATKIALNIISTGAMVRLGRVHGNLMIDLQPTNTKLRDRALRLVTQLTGCDREAARSLLERADWNVRVALGKNEGGKV